MSRPRAILERMGESRGATMAQRWRKAAQGLSGDARLAFLRWEWQARPVEAVADALDRVCSAAEQAEPDARELLISVVDLLTDRASEPFVQALREEAAGRSLLALGRLLRRPLRSELRAIGPKREHIPDYGKGRPLTLGERKALARRPTRAALEKLLADPHPMVIRALLANPKLVEDDVVRLAARRPAVADVLVEIAKSTRWAHRVRVRMALVLNPWSPPEIAIPFVGLLVRAELRLVAESTEVPVAVRATARDLLARRPPVRSNGAKPPVH